MVVFLSVCLDTLCLLDAYGDNNAALEFLELELNVARSGHVDDGK